jgi:hypothetical protein
MKFRRFAQLENIQDGHATGRVLLPAYFGVSDYLNDAAPFAAYLRI